MSREVRRVPANWKHPEDRGRPEPLRDGYREDLAEFVARIEEKGAAEAIDHFGGGPQSVDYMPDWPKGERTHYQMYETCSEGTPISPVMETPEKLARWMADNSASSFASMTATYEQWLSMIKGSGSSISMAMDSGEIISGVELESRDRKSTE